MIDFGIIVGFEWDAGNARKSEEKHGVSQADAEQAFFNDPLFLNDVKHSADEDRFQALGATNDGRLLHVTFTLRAKATLIRVISARPMNAKERLRYGEEA